MCQTGAPNHNGKGHSSNNASFFITVNDVRDDGEIARRNAPTLFGPRIVARPIRHCVAAAPRRECTVVNGERLAQFNCNAQLVFMGETDKRVARFYCFGGGGSGSNW
jgi:hypothetical protein